MGISTDDYTHRTGTMRPILLWGLCLPRPQLSGLGAKAELAVSGVGQATTATIRAPEPDNPTRLRLVLKRSYAETPLHSRLAVRPSRHIVSVGPVHVNCNVVDRPDMRVLGLQAPGTTQTLQRPSTHPVLCLQVSERSATLATRRSRGAYSSTRWTASLIFSGFG